jgi:hypothetical protein
MTTGKREEGKSPVIFVIDDAESYDLTALSHWQGIGNILDDLPDFLSAS